MQVELTTDQLSALMLQLPAESTGPFSGFAYAEGLLTVPEAHVPAVSAILADPNWQEVAARDRLVAYAAERRWRKEVGGIVVAGVPVATDDRSKLMVTGARVAAQADSGWATVWHGADGQTYPIDAASLIAISDAVQAHVNAGFAIFATVKAAIEAGEITTTGEIDAAFEAA